MFNLEANYFFPNFQNLAPLFIVLAIWEIYWKGRGLWASAQKKEKWWFIAMLLINTVGILPIAYLYYFSKKK